MIAGQDDEIVLALDVPVDRRRAGAEPSGQRSHVQSFHAFVIEQLDGG
jgi:hypothetical protein